MNTVDTVYLFLVMKPHIWAMRPGVDDTTSWLIATAAPGLVVGGGRILFTGDFDLHGLLVAFSNMQAAYFETLQLRRYNGRSPLAAICLILATGK